MGTRVFQRNALSTASTVHGGKLFCTGSTPSPSPSRECSQVCLLFSSSVMKRTLLLPFLHLSIDSVLEREISIFHLLGFPQIPAEK